MIVDEDDESEVVVVLVEMKIVVLIFEIVVDEVMNEKVTEMGHGGVGR